MAPIKFYEWPGCVAQLVRTSSSSAKVVCSVPGQGACRVHVINAEWVDQQTYVSLSLLAYPFSLKLTNKYIKTY